MARGAGPAIESRDFPLHSVGGEFGDAPQRQLGAGFDLEEMAAQFFAELQQED